METLGPEITSFLPAHLADSILFDDRIDAGARLARILPDDLHQPVVAGTTRGGVEIAAELAAILHAPLDVVFVAPVLGPEEYEHAVGAVTAAEGVYLRDDHRLSDAQTVVAVARARKEAGRVDALLHERRAQLPMRGREVVLVDEAVTTGATMAAAVAWARANEARRVVAAVPVGATPGLEVVRGLADDVVCLYEFEVIGSRRIWFGYFPRPEDEEVRQLLEATR
jgi:putative phosphoribosyl transferase